MRGAGGAGGAAGAGALSPVPCLRPVPPPARTLPAVPPSCTLCPLPASCPHPRPPSARPLLAPCAPCPPHDPCLPAPPRPARPPSPPPALPQRPRSELHPAAHRPRKVSFRGNKNTPKKWKKKGKINPNEPHRQTPNPVETAAKAAPPPQHGAAGGTGGSGPDVTQRRAALGAPRPNQNPTPFDFSFPIYLLSFSFHAGRGNVPPAQFLFLSVPSLRVTSAVSPRGERGPVGRTVGTGTKGWHHAGSAPIAPRIPPSK